MNAIIAVNPSHAIPLQRPDPLIAIEKLQVRFGEVAAIDGLNLIVHRGEFISLLGPSGCGKSTLLRAIARLVPLAGGDIIMRDTQLRVGFMFQKPLLLPWRTALGNVVLPVEIQNGGSVVDSTDDYRARRDIAQALASRAQHTTDTTDQIQSRQQIGEAQQVTDYDLRWFQPQSAGLNHAQPEQPLADSLPPPKPFRHDSVEQ